MSTQEENRLESPTAGPGDSSDVSESDEATKKPESDEAREKPEPDEAAKKKASEMMAAYVDRPTLVLPGSGGAVSGTAVNDWLDENGDPKYGKDGPSDDAKAADDGATEDGAPEYMTEEKIAKDKEYNQAVMKEAKERAGKDEDAAEDEDAAKDGDAAKDEKAASK